MREKSRGTSYKGTSYKGKSAGYQKAGKGSPVRDNKEAKTKYAGRTEKSESSSFAGRPEKSDSSRYAGRTEKSDAPKYAGRTEKSGSSSYAGRPEKSDSSRYTGRSEKSDSSRYAGRTERADAHKYAGRTERSDSSRYAGRTERSDAPKYAGRIEKSDSSRYAGRTEKSDSSRYVGRTEKSDSSRYAGRPEKSDTSRYAGKTENSDSSRYAGRPEKSDTSRYAGKTEKSDSSRYAGRTEKSDSSRYAGKTENSDSSRYAGRTEKSDSLRYAGRTEKSDTSKYAGRTEKSDSPKYKDKGVKTDTGSYSKKSGAVDYSQKSNYNDDKFEELDYDLYNKYVKGKEKHPTSTDKKVVHKNDFTAHRSSKTEKPMNRDTRQQENNGFRNVAKPGSCLYSWECGGCNVLQQSYDLGLKEKHKSVENLIGKYCKVEPIIGMENPKHYRNKVHVVFDHDKKGNPISGVYVEGSHRVVPIENCLIHNQKADEIIATIRGMLKSFKIKTYDEDSGYGLLRHVLIRTGFASGEIMVVLVLGSPIMPSKNNFVKALRLQHPEITTVVTNVNDKKTSMVLGDKEQVIYGKGYIEDSLCQKTFRISPKSFYQVNPAGAEIIYKKAIELAGLTGSEIVIDAYSGIGTIGIIASDHAKKVIGVELNKDAVRDANINAKRNDVQNIEFYKNDAGVFMSQMASQSETADVVFMDPPRNGSNEQFMDALAVLKPKKVVYISCNPISLERDLEYLSKRGFKAERAIPVDMFPWTNHVETVCLMSK